MIVIHFQKNPSFSFNFKNYFLNVDGWQFKDLKLNSDKCHLKIKLTNLSDTLDIKTEDMYKVEEISQRY